MNAVLTGWDIGHADDIEWIPWDTGELARAKILAVADGYHTVLVEARAGYRGGAHDHAHPEFLYVVRGALRTQGVELSAGDAYAAAAGSTHDDFVIETDATYVLTFKL